METDQECPHYQDIKIVPIFQVSLCTEDCKVLDINGNLFDWLYL